MINPVDEVISILGSQAKVAIECGVRQQSVGKWRKNGRVPPARAVQIEKIVKGKVKRNRLCPGFIWN